MIGSKALWAAVAAIAVFAAAPILASSDSSQSDWQGQEYNVYTLDDLDKIPGDAVSIRVLYHGDEEYSLEGFAELRKVNLVSTRSMPDLPDSVEVVRLPDSAFGTQSLEDARPNVEQVMEVLTALPSLRQLSIMVHLGSSVAVASIRGLKQLEHLEIAGSEGLVPQGPWGVRGPDLNQYIEVMEAVAELGALKVLHYNLRQSPAPAMAIIAEALALESFASRTIDDAGLQTLCMKCPSLTKLDLTGNNNVTDLGLAYVGKLQNLRTLLLAGCRLVGDYALPYLAECGNLEALDISGSSNDIMFATHTSYANHVGEKYLSDRRHRFHMNIDSLKHLKQLRALKLSGLPSLHFLVLQDLLLGLPNLEVLDISGCSRWGEDDEVDNPATEFALPAAADFSFLANVTSLRTLRLDRLYWKDNWFEAPRPCIATNDLLEALPLLPSLEVLSMRGAVDLTDEAINGLSRCEGLRSLDVRALRRHWSEPLRLSEELLGKLTELKVSRLEEQELDKVARHSKLRSLTVSQWPTELGRRDSYRTLASMKHLESVELTGNAALRPQIDLEELLKSKSIKRITLTGFNWLKQSPADIPDAGKVDVNAFRNKAVRQNPEVELMLHD